MGPAARPDPLAKILPHHPRIGLARRIAFRYTFAMESELARFIIGGAVLLVGSERLALSQWSGAATRFWASPLWCGLRYSLFAATIILALHFI